METWMIVLLVICGFFLFVAIVRACSGSSYNGSSVVAKKKNAEEESKRLSDEIHRLERIQNSYLNSAMGRNYDLDIEIENARIRKEAVDKRIDIYNDIIARKGF